MLSFVWAVIPAQSEPFVKNVLKGLIPIPANWATC